MSWYFQPLSGDDATVVGAGGVSSGEAVGSPGIRAKVLAVGAIVSMAAFGVPIVHNFPPHLCGGIASGEAFGSATVISRPVIGSAGAIASIGAVGSPSIGGVVSSTGGIVSGEASGSGGIVGVIVPAGIASAGVVGSPAAAGSVVTAGGIASAQGVGSHLVRFVPGTISAAGVISSGEAIGGLALRGTISGAGGISTAEAVGSLAQNGSVIGAGGINRNERGFNTGLEAWDSATKPTDWGSLSAGSCSVNRDSSPRGGIYCARLDIGDSLYAYIHISPLAGSMTNTGFHRVAGWYKTEAGKTAGIAIQVTGQSIYWSSGGQWVNGFSLLPLPEAVSWTRFMFVFREHPSYDRVTVSFGAGLGFGGSYNFSARYDDITISEELVGVPALYNKTILGAGGIPGVEVVAQPGISGVIAGAGGVGSAEAIGGQSMLGTIAPSGVPTGAAIGSGMVSGTIAAGSVASGEAFGDQAVAEVLPDVLRSSGISTAEAVGSHRIVGVISQAGAIGSGEIVGSPSVNGIIGPPGIGSGEALGTPAAVGPIVPGGIVSSGVVGTPSLLASVSGVGGIGSEEAVATPSVNGTIFPSGVSGAGAVGVPVVVEPGAIYPAGIPSGEEFGEDELVDHFHLGESCYSWSERCDGPIGDKASAIGPKGEALGEKARISGSRCGRVGEKPKRCPD